MMRGYGQVPGIPGLENAPADQVILVLGNQNPDAITCVPGSGAQKSICIGPQERFKAEEQESKMTGVIMGALFGGVGGILIGYWLKGQIDKRK